MDWCVPLLAVFYNKPWEHIDKCVFSTIKQFSSTSPKNSFFVIKSIFLGVSNLIPGEYPFVNKKILFGYQRDPYEESKSILINKYNSNLHISIGSHLSIEVFVDFLTIRVDWSTQHEGYANPHWERVTYHSYDKTTRYNKDYDSHILEELESLGLKSWETYTGKQIVENLIYIISLSINKPNFKEL
jgi:hypothetical protein